MNKTELEKIRQKAEAGNPTAMLLLGLAYLQGKGVKKDLQQFSEWTKKAAEAGDPTAMFNLSIAYLEGEGVKKNLPQYYEWIKMAAEAGIPTAMFNLSIAYLNGTGVEKDLEQFFEWTEKAAKAETLSGRKVILDGIIRINKAETELTDKLEQIGQLEEALFSLHDTINEIIETKHLINKETTWESAAHFTHGEALPRILTDNVLRLYNVSYMNDPDEGKRLLYDDLKRSNTALLRGFLDDAGNKDAKPDDHHKLSWGNDEYCAYVGSFTKEVDRLDLWRAYGNNGNGFCIVTPIAAFDTSADTSGEHAYITSLSTEKGARLRLYKVLYTKKEAQGTLATLAPHLQELKEMKKMFSDDARKIKILHEIVRVLFCKIRYLYKSEEYQTENEARIIEVVHTGDAKLLHDNDETPYKLYVESEPVFFNVKGSKIIIGPRVKESTVWEWDLKHRIRTNNWHETTKIRHSKIHYR